MTLKFEYKALSMEEDFGGPVIHMIVIGKIEKEDYDLFVSEVEAQIEKYGKLRLFLELHDFKIWSTGGFWRNVSSLITT